MDTGAQKELLSLKTKKRVFDSEKSYLRKYQRIAVGNENLLSLVRYEMITTMLGWVPGVLGVFLRKHFYPYLFNPKLQNVIFGKNVDIFNPNGIKIGENCLIGDNCLLEAKTGGKISIGNKSSLGRGTLVRCALGSIEIGDNAGIAAYSHVSAMGTNVIIGKHAAIGAHTYINGAAGYDFDAFEGPMTEHPRIGKGIIIEDNVWIGASVIVIDGNKIGTGSVIGAGSIVTKDIPEYSVAVGVPAKVIKSRRQKPLSR